MASHDIVVIGGSAGGFEALKELCRHLPADFPAAIFVVLHITPNSRSVLPDLLTRLGKLPARHPSDGEPIVSGRIYVAPPDHHLLVEEGHVLVRRGPYENRTRPAIDPLFRSAAVAYGSRVVGVVLSGTLDDGSAGLISIKLCGGICVIQDPADAAWPEMPLNALRRDHADYTLPVARIGALLARLAQEPAGENPPVPRNLIIETSIAAQENPVAADKAQLGRPTPISCPQCGGVLNEVTAEGSTRFRCQIGHGFTAEGLLSAQNDELERALESAMRIHRDRVVLFRRMQKSAETQSMEYAAARWKSGADESEHAAELIEQALEKMRRPPEEPAAAAQ